jgi:toxin ParE1/3/4
VNLFWTRRATEEWRNLQAGIARDSPAAAQKVGQRILDAAEKLRRFPHMGRPGRAEDTRELVVSGTPHIFAYRIRATRIVVRAILHGAQQWPPRFPETEGKIPPANSRHVN